MGDEFNCITVPVAVNKNRKFSILLMDSYPKFACHVRRNVLAVAVNANYKAPPMILLTSLQ